MKTQLKILYFIRSKIKLIATNNYGYTVNIQNKEIKTTSIRIELNNIKSFIYISSIFNMITAANSSTSIRFIYPKKGYQLNAYDFYTNNMILNNLNEALLHILSLT